MSEDLDFMQIDCDYVVSENHDPLIRMFGLTKDKNSILVLVSGFEPYFYIQAPEALDLSEANISKLRDSLNKNLSEVRTIKIKECIRRIEIC